MTTELELDEDHAEEAEALLPHQFKDADNLKAILGALTAQVQAAENMIFNLWQSRWLDNAAGAQLDGLGAIVGVDREGLEDDAYRIMIRVQILVNASSGTFDQILAIFEHLDPDNTYVIEEMFPAGFQISALLPFDAPVSEARMGRLLGDAKAAGVEAQLVYQTQENAFRFSSTSSLEASDDEGFATRFPIVASSAGTGGGWAEVKATSTWALVHHGGGKYRESNDGGATWEAEVDMSDDFDMCKAIGENFVVLTNGATEFRYQPGGEAFVETDDPFPADDVVGDYVYHADSDRLIVCGDGGYIWHLQGLGTGTWVTENPGGTEFLRVAHVTENGIAIVAGDDGVIHRSATGDGFSQVAALGFAILWLASVGDTIVALGATIPTVGVSYDGGLTWATKATGRTGNVVGLGIAYGQFNVAVQASDDYVEVFDDDFDFLVALGPIDFTIEALVQLPTTVVIWAENDFTYIRQDEPTEPGVPKLKWIFATAGTNLRGAAASNGYIIFANDNENAGQGAAVRCPDNLQASGYGGAFAGVVEGI